MKKILALLILSASLTACNNSSNGSHDKDDSDSTVVKDSVQIVDSINNSYPSESHAKTVTKTVSNQN